MTTWNHRVVRREYPDAAIEEDRVMYQVHEAYYDGDGNCVALTQDPEQLMEQDVNQLRSTLERITTALDKPVLDYETRLEVTA